MPDIKAIEKRYDVEIYHHMTEKMKVNEYHTNLDGCGYVVAKGVTAEAAEMRAALALEAVRRDAFEVS